MPNNVLKVRRPVDAKYPISSPFGSRPDPFNAQQTKFHNGVDFAVPVGTPVKAMLDGEIIRAGYEDSQDVKKGYGLRVMQSNKNYFYWYGHLSKLKVQEGDFVHSGDVIGYSGNSGQSTGPHLHVGARLKNSGTFYDLEFTP